MSIHTCSYYCDRPECIRAQRDELRQAIEQAEKQRAQIIRPRGKSWLTVNPEGKVEIRKIK